MSGKLVGEVVEWLKTPAARGISQAERVVLLVVAERANETDRIMWRHRTDTESLHERIRSALDVSAGALGNVLGRLAKRGLEVRIPTGVDKRGRPTFANNGHSMRFRLPEFPASVALPPSERSIDGWTFPVDNPSDQPVDNPSSDHTKVHQRMDLPGERSIDGWTFEGERSIDGWTVYPSKENPSQSQSPSAPVVLSHGAEVEGDPAAHKPKIERDRERDQLPSGTDGYAAASAALAELPDLGSALLDAARANLPASTPLDQLVIHAAALTRRTA